MSTFPERILDASVPSVITACGNRVQKLEDGKLVIDERMANAKRSARDFDVTVQTALNLLASSCNLRRSERLEDERTVLKLVLVQRSAYQRREDFEPRICPCRSKY